MSQSSPMTHRNAESFPLIMRQSNLGVAKVFLAVFLFDAARRLERARKNIVHDQLAIAAVAIVLRSEVLLCDDLALVGRDLLPHDHVTIMPNAVGHLLDCVRNLARAAGLHATRGMRFSHKYALVGSLLAGYIASETLCYKRRFGQILLSCAKDLLVSATSAGRGPANRMRTTGWQLSCLT